MANTIYILEGADGAGKTTFSKYLQEKYGAKYIHCSYSKEIDQYSMIKYMEKKFLEALDASIYNPVILDRHIISTLIYEHVYRRKIQDRPELLEYAKLIFSIINSSSRLKVILCHLDYPDWKENFLRSVISDGKIEMYEFDAKLIEVYKSYESLKNTGQIFGCKIPLETYNFKKDLVTYW